MVPSGMGEATIKIGDSAAQVAAEATLLAAASIALGVALSPARLHIGEVYIDVDGVDPTGSVLVEATAMIGAPKGAQQKKLAADVLKLGWARRALGDVRCVIVTWSPEVHAFLSRPRAWLTAACAEAAVEVLLVESDEVAFAAVSAARAAQDRYSM